MRSYRELQEPPASEKRSLHPAAIAVLSARNLRGLILAFIPALALGQWTLLFILPLTFSVVGGVIRFLTTRFYFEGDSLIIESGLISRLRRVLPLARIQSVEVIQGLVHRVFNVVELRAEAIGGGNEGEARLAALDPVEAEQLRARLLASSAPDAVSTETELPSLAHLGPKELLLAGATGGRVAVVAALLGYGFELLPEDNPIEPLLSTGVQTLVVLGTAFLVVSLAISIVATVAVYWNFTVSRTDDRLTVTRGLLETRRSLIPMHRIQSVSVNENPIRRLFGLASLTIVVAGYAGKGQELERLSTLLPIGSRRSVLQVASELFPKDALAKLDGLEPVPMRALFRNLVYVWLFALVVASAAAWRLGLIGLFLGAGVFVVGGLLSWARWKALANFVDDDFVISRHGAVVRHTSFVRRSNVQNLGFSAGPLQRVFGLASLTLGVPKAKTHLADLDENRARARFELLARTISS